jgi:hypothetical protein
MISAQPLTVMSASRVAPPGPSFPLEAFAANERVEQVGDDQDRDDQAEDVGGAHGGERQHGQTRSIAKMKRKRMANIAIPKMTATMSMGTTIGQGLSHRRDDVLLGHHDFVTVFSAEDGGGTQGLAGSRVPANRRVGSGRRFRVRPAE